MAQAAKTNREEESHRVSGFSLMEPVGKLGAYPRRLRQFLHDVRVEMKQVNWPSRFEVWSTTVVVTITVAFFGVFFYITDSIFSRLYLIVTRYFHH
ncbi:MAG: preprotein translocase subunit SecE [Candidatus Acidiferrales bacterium]